MATQKVFCSYQEIIDLHTESDRVSVIGIHTPTGDTPHKMFKGFFDQFKKFSYLGASISLVPAARLPVDPLQVSYDAGEPTIDPRDTLNPIMWHGAHGEDLGNILNSLYQFGNIVPGAGQRSIFDELGSDSADLAMFSNISDMLGDFTLLEKLYYKALTDNSWKKAHPQRGFRKSGLRPMVYKVSSTHQIMPSASMDSTYPEGIVDDAAIMGYPTFDVSQAPPRIIPQVSKLSENILATRLTGLGWLDTRTPLSAGEYTPVVVTKEGTKYDLNTAIDTLYNQNSHLTELPKIYMGIIMLPPAYKTEQYFRLIINHRFVFGKFRSISFQNDLNEDTPSYFNWNDEISNDLGSGGDDNGGDDESPVGTVSGSSTLGYSQANDFAYDLYPKLTVGDQEYTASSTSGNEAGFVVIDGQIYLAYGADMNNLFVFTSATGGTQFVMEGGSTGSSFTATPNFTLSPSDSDLVADLLDGGIEYGE